MSYSRPMAVDAGLVSSADTTDRFLSPENGANRRKRSTSTSLSISRSHLSDTSHTTLVEDNPQFIAEHQAVVDKHAGPAAKRKPLYLILNSIRKVFCVGVPRQTMVEQKKINRVSTENFSSPWNQEVYVLTARRDPDIDPVAKLAGCIIDTGNMQGNIVSRAFVEELGYTESSFRELKNHEKRGGIGITNEKLIPIAAINLTWYRKGGTRVIRDMRFLISPHPHADMIVGARSIETYGLLTVPNFMVSKVLPIPVKRDQTKDKLNRRYKQLDEKMLSYNLAAREARRDNDPVSAASNKKLSAFYTAKRDVVKYELLIHEEGLKKPPNGPNQQDIGKWQDEINDLKKTLDGLKDEETKEAEEAEEAEEAQKAGDPTSLETKKDL